MFRRLVLVIGLVMALVAGFYLVAYLTLPMQLDVSIIEENPLAGRAAAAR